MAMKQNPLSQTPMLNEQEAAAILGLSRRTLQAWRRLGKGPKYKKLGERAVRYELETLQAFGANRQSTSEEV